MSRMLCKCGATMGTSVSPSPYSIFVFYEQEVKSAIAENPKILLSDFLTGWDEIRGTQKEYMKRPEIVEYWYCPECHRVYETQVQIGGHWLRVYERSEEQLQKELFALWRKIYVFKEIDTDTLLEKTPQLLLSEYIEMQKEVQYLISPDERTVVAISGSNNELQFVYIQEEGEQMNK